MKELRQLSPKDVLFVGGETSRIHQHTGGLTVLDPEGRDDVDYWSFRAHLEERLGGIPQFRWRLHEVPLGLDLPYWVEDEEFSFDNHVRRIAVPAPGDRRALGELVSYLYSRHLDRRHPLWEIWWLEGLEGGQCALFAKLHHSLMDGEGANKLGESICDLEPDAAPREIPAELADQRPGQVPGAWRESLQAAWRLSGLPVRATWELADGARRAIAQRLPGSGARTADGPVPLTSFNCDIGPERGFVFGSVPLGDVKAVKNHFGVTVNDVVLALVASSLRTHLAKFDDLPEESLRTSIPVSLRTEEDDQFSNRITTTTVTLATTEEDPVERLRAIAADSVEAKRAAHAGAKGFVELISILPPALVGAVMSATPASLAVRATGFNLLVSNVRGSPVPLYVAGARTTAMYPMSIIAPGNGLNVTCISYLDDLDFGLTIEPSAFREPWRLVDGISDALDTYVGLLP